MSVFTFDIPTLETERLILRAPCPADFPAFAEFYASPRSQFVGGPATAEQSWRFLAGELGHWPLRGYGRWAVEEKSTGRLAGIIGPWNAEGWPEPELGWDLMNEFEGKGYATEAASAGRAYAYDVLGWTTMISLVSPENTASARLAERLGCKRDGDFDHVRHGFLHVWRHPAPDELADGGMEAYA